MKVFFKKISRCPLCSSRSYIKYSKTYSNRYSEQISGYLKISEDDLIKKIYNVQCNNCGLIYKKNWFINQINTILKNYKYIILVKNKKTTTFSRIYVFFKILYNIL